MKFNEVVEEIEIKDYDPFEKHHDKAVKCPYRVDDISFNHWNREFIELEKCKNCLFHKGIKMKKVVLCNYAFFKRLVKEITQGLL